MRFDGSIQVTIEFSFNQTSPSVGIGYSQDGQPIEPSTGPQWEVEGFTVSTEDITSSDKAGTMYEEILDMINGHIEENYLYLTSE